MITLDSTVYKCIYRKVLQFQIALLSFYKPVKLFENTYNTILVFTPGKQTGFGNVALCNKDIFTNSNVTNFPLLK